MTNFLELLYLLTSISAVVALVLMWRARRSPETGAIRQRARYWAITTVALAIGCVALYWYLGTRLTPLP